MQASKDEGYSKSTGRTFSQNYLHPAIYDGLERVLLLKPPKKEWCRTPQETLGIECYGNVYAAGSPTGHEEHTEGNQHRRNQKAQSAQEIVQAKT